MKAIFSYTKWRTIIGAILVICIAAIQGMGCFSHRGIPSDIMERNPLTRNDSNDEATHSAKLYISSNEFSKTDQNVKNESLNQTFC